MPKSLVFCATLCFVFGLLSIPTCFLLGVPSIVLALVSMVFGVLVIRAYVLGLANNETEVLDHLSLGLTLDRPRIEPDRFVPGDLHGVQDLSI